MIQLVTLYYIVKFFFPWFFPLLLEERFFHVNLLYFCMISFTSVCLDSIGGDQIFAEKVFIEI